jgi:hypothetical protein
MKELTNTGSKGVKDRWLGDEWLEWKGDLENYQGIINERKRTFLLISFAVFLFILISSFIFLYLVYPRLQQIGSWVPAATLVIFALFTILFLFGFLLMAITVILDKNLLVGFIRKAYLINMLFRISASIGEKFGISKDRMSNSFIKVNNALQKFICFGSLKAENLLILLPRCLSKDIRKRVQEICRLYNCKAYIASGGDAARRIILEKKPLAILGVACERDLVSGIRDTTPKIPVIGIENKRPEGPCKNTLIDTELFEKTVASLLDRSGVITNEKYRTSQRIPIPEDMNSSESNE